MPIQHWNIHETEYAVVDLETTGFSPGNDRIVEVAVVRVGSDGQVQLVLDTIVNPGIAMRGTDFHGIAADDVVEAPVFHGVATRLMSSLEGCVVVAHNATFDVRCLQSQLGELGVAFDVPYLCTMRLGGMLRSDGGRVSLDEACADEGVKRMERKHSAAVDAIDTAKLLVAYLRRLLKQRRHTFGDLADMRFSESFVHDPVVPGTFSPEANPAKLVSRFDRRGSSDLDLAYRTYFTELLQVLMDLHVSPEEAARLARKRRDLDLKEEHVRALHAQAFASTIMQFLVDKRMGEEEALYLRRLADCLGAAGWCPGR